MQRILFIGDSITDAGRTNHLPPLGGGYVHFFDLLMKSNYPGRPLDIVNKGISGNTIEGLRLRWERDVMGQDADQLVMMVGINDIHVGLNDARGMEVIFSEYFRIYGELLARSSEKFAENILVMTPFYLPEDREHPIYGRVKGLNQSLSAVCCDRSVDFLDLQLLFERRSASSPLSYWAPDAVHPHAHGHMLIALELFDNFEERLLP